MTPLNYFTTFIWVHKQAGEVQEYEDTRTGDTFTSKEKVNQHCRREAENFQSEEL